MRFLMRNVFSYSDFQNCAGPALAFNWHHRFISISTPDTGTFPCYAASLFVLAFWSHESLHLRGYQNSYIDKNRNLAEFIDGMLEGNSSDVYHWFRYFLCRSNAS